MNTQNCQISQIILLELGQLFLLCIMAAAFYLAHRRTSLFGFRLLFYFAAGKLFLSLVGGLAIGLVAKYFTINTLTFVAYARMVLGYALYILPLAGLALLMRDSQSATRKSLEPTANT